MMKTFNTNALRTGVETVNLFTVEGRAVDPDAGPNPLTLSEKKETRLRSAGLRRQMNNNEDIEDTAKNIEANTSINEASLLLAEKQLLNSRLGKGGFRRKGSS